MSSDKPLIIRAASEADRAAIWSILQPVIREGETYALNRDLPRDDALAYWMERPDHCYVAEREGQIIGTYYLTRNHEGGGSHICNCGYITAPDARGQGLARRMCAHSQDEALRLGFRAMQFNFVVASNMDAVHLWESCGFAIAGRLPDAFDHPRLGYVDALIMFKGLTFK